MFKKFLPVIRLITGLLLLGLLFYWIPWGNLVKAFQQVNILYCVLAFSLSLTVFALSAAKLYLLLNYFKISISYFETYQAYYIGSFFNNFVPTSIGGDLFKFIELNRNDNINPKENFLAIGLDRISGIVVLVFLALIFLIFKPEYFVQVGVNLQVRSFLFYLTVFIVATGVIIWVLNFWSKLTDFYTKIKESILVPIKCPRLTLYLLLLSFGFHLIRGLNYYLLVMAFGAEIDFFAILFILPIVTFASFLPISMGGIGIREGILTFSLNSFGVPLPASFGVSIILRAFSIFHSSIGGLFYSYRTFSRSK